MSPDMHCFCGQAVPGARLARLRARAAASLGVPVEQSARRRLLGLGAILGLAPLAVLAQAMPAAADRPLDAAADVPSEVRAAFTTPTLQGQGRLRFLGLRVYDAYLWVPAGQPLAGDNWVQPLALEIRYQRALQGQQIADRSLQEMQRQGPLDEATGQRWLQAMRGQFPDVVAGSRITGLHLPGVGARFYVDGRLKGTVGDAEFARRFFGIWLSPQTSDQRLRSALLGQAVP